MVITRRQSCHGCWGCLQVSRTMTKAENQTNAKLQTEVTFELFEIHHLRSRH